MASNLRFRRHLYLEVLVKGVSVEKLNFTVIVELILDEFVLSIQDRKITAVRTGRNDGEKVRSTGGGCDYREGRRCCPATESNFPRRQ
jgi:hypothetical protein